MQIVVDLGGRATKAQVYREAKRRDSSPVDVYLPLAALRRHGYLRWDPGSGTFSLTGPLPERYDDRAGWHTRKKEAALRKAGPLMMWLLEERGGFLPTEDLARAAGVATTWVESHFERLAEAAPGERPILDDVYDVETRRFRGKAVFTRSRYFALRQEWAKGCTTA